jgi:hypothetical protein
VTRCITLSKLSSTVLSSVSGLLYRDNEGGEDTVLMLDSTPLVPYPWNPRAFSEFCR